MITSVDDGVKNKRKGKDKQILERCQRIKKRTMTVKLFENGTLGTVHKVLEKRPEELE